jgi:DNA-binding response OmpR family regulator
VRLLLVEDSVRLQRSLGKGLRGVGYAVDLTGDGREGLRQARAHDYDVIILDLMIPGMDGLSVLRNLRAEGCQSHVLILTARDAVEDRVLGLQTGADDYVVKPFSFSELVARVQALARRGHHRKDPVIQIGAVQINTASRTVYRDGAVVELAAREYALLELLAMRRGEVVTRSSIEEHIYDDRAELMSNVVDAAIYVLRRALDRKGEASIIETRRGMGYMIRGRGT